MHSSPLSLSVSAASRGCCFFLSATRPLYHPPPRSPSRPIPMAVADAAADAAATAADVVATPHSYWSGVGIVALSAVLALAMEAFTWAMVYRKEDYQAAKARVKVLAERRTCFGVRGGGLRGVAAVGWSVVVCACAVPAWPVLLCTSQRVCWLRHMLTLYSVCCCLRYAPLLGVPRLYPPTPPSMSLCPPRPPPHFFASLFSPPRPSRPRGSHHRARPPAQGARKALGGPDGGPQNRLVGAQHADAHGR